MNRKGVGKVKGMVRWFLPFYLFVFLPFTVSAQRLLTLDSCRAMALRNNKQMRISEVKQDVAANARKSARTKYLPHVSAIGTYEHTSREISLLSDAQKSSFPNLGTALATGLQPQVQGLTQVLTQLGGTFVQMGMPAAQVQQTMGGLQTQMQDGITTLAGQLNALGSIPTPVTSGPVPSC